MFQKASELQAQLAQYRESVAQKKKVIEFSHCYNCKNPLEFSHVVDTQREFVVEKCACPTCGAQADDRRFRLQ